MTRSFQPIDASFVCKHFDYDAATGVFVAVTDGASVYHLLSGYVQLRAEGQQLLAHRVAWVWVHGYLAAQIDHIDGDPSNNRIKNLRPSNQSQNKQNSRPKRTTAHGLKGICFERGRKKPWRADIGPRNGVRFLGRFATAEEAHAAYAKAAGEMYGEFARTS